MSLETPLSPLTGSGYLYISLSLSFCLSMGGSCKELFLQVHSAEYAKNSNVFCILLQIELSRMLTHDICISPLLKWLYIRVDISYFPTIYMHSIYLDMSMSELHHVFKETYDDNHSKSIYYFIFLALHLIHFHFHFHTSFRAGSPVPWRNEGGGSEGRVWSFTPAH